MKRYFDLPEVRQTLLVEVKVGSSASRATPERIRLAHELLDICDAWRDIRT